MFDVLIHLQHRGGAHRMSGITSVVFSLQRSEFKRWLACQMGINEQNQIPPFQIQCMFDLELEIGQVFDVWIFLGLQLFQQQGSKGVVTTARVAVAEYQEFWVSWQWRSFK